MRRTLIGVVSFDECVEVCVADERGKKWLDRKMLRTSPHRFRPLVAVSGISHHDDRYGRVSLTELLMKKLAVDGRQLVIRQDTMTGPSPSFRKLRLNHFMAEPSGADALVRLRLVQVSSPSTPLILTFRWLERPCSSV
jgi:hypothetical protein